MSSSTLDASAPRRRLALTALTLALVALVLSVDLAIVDSPRGAVGLALHVVALTAAWHGLVHRGAVHAVGLGAGALLVIVMMVLLIADRPGLVLGAMAHSPHVRVRGRHGRCIRLS